MHIGMGRLEFGRAMPDAEQADSLRHGTVSHLVSLDTLLPYKTCKGYCKYFERSGLRSGASRWPGAVSDSQSPIRLLSSQHLLEPLEMVVSDIGLHRGGHLSSTNV